MFTLIFYSLKKKNLIDIHLKIWRMYYNLSYQVMSDMCDILSPVSFRFH